MIDTMTFKIALSVEKISEIIRACKETRQIRENWKGRHSYVFGRRNEACYAEMLVRDVVGMHCAFCSNKFKCGNHIKDDLRFLR